MIGKLRVLLLEDVQKDAELLQEILTEEGYSLEMDVVETESDFVAKLKRQNYDIIYADYTLPSFNGQQALVLAKNICPSVPFVFISGTIGEDMAVELLKQGATDYVLKDRIHRVGMATKRAIDAMAQLKQFREKEIEMQTNRRLLQNIINNALDSIYVKDLKGRYLLFNEAAERVTGILAKEVIGRDDTFVYSEAEAKSFMESDQKVFESGEPMVLEGPITVKGGTQRIFNTIKCPMYDDNGRMTGLFGISRDITDRKLMEKSLFEAKEKAEESDRLKTSFLQNVSHEIRTPLNAIVGFSGLLGDTDIDKEKTKNYIEIISHSSDQLTSIISDIISIASIESGLEKVTAYEIDLNELMRTIYQQSILLAKKQNLSVSLEIKGVETANRIVTDGVKLNQILQNLIGNAIKYTKEGSVKFGYTCNNSALQFFVEDTGIGIPEEMLKTIFKRFIRVESDLTIKTRGSGLGLSIAKAYVELLGGMIDASSTVGQGSRFVFTIPYKQSEGIIFSDFELGNQFHFTLKGPKKILIAEDEDLNYQLLEEFLTDENIHIQRAVNGKEAVAMCQSDPSIDLVLMDLKMPVLNGYDATTCIREFRPELPIIAQTAYSTELDRTKAFAHGCTDFISKPYKHHQLLTLVMKYLT